MVVQPDRAAWLQRNGTCCDNPAHSSTRECRIVLLGPPAVGKGTQATLLASFFQSCHLSTGELFRRAQQCDPAGLTPAMHTAVRKMEAGELVDDTTVIRLLLDRGRCIACHGGFLLAGLPRTIGQAATLDVLLARDDLKIDYAIEYQLPHANLLERAAGRRICPSCSAVYHRNHRPPQNAGICDQCAVELVRRADDMGATLQKRLQTYATNTACLRSYYFGQGKLVNVDARGTPDEVFARTITVLSEFLK